MLLLELIHFMHNLFCSFVLLTFIPLSSHVPLPLLHLLLSSMIVKNCCENFFDVVATCMLEKITAEEKLNNKVQYLLEKPNVENSLKVPKSKAASKNVEKKMVVTMGYMDQSSPMTSPSDSSWDPILDSPDRRNLEDFLTEQEKIDLRNLVLARKGMTPPDEVILTEESQ